MLGPHVCLQLVLPGKGARARRTEPGRHGGVRELMTTQPLPGLEELAACWAREGGTS